MIALLYRKTHKNEECCRIGKKLFKHRSLQTKKATRFHEWLFNYLDSRI